MDELVCQRCGRRMEPRKSWTSRGVTPKYCSERCRRAPKADDGLEAAILEILDARARSATICPSEAARRVDPEGWRDHLEDARAAARRLVAKGLVDITQGGVVVDPSTAKGAIRVRRRDS